MSLGPGPRRVRILLTGCTAGQGCGRYDFRFLDQAESISAAFSEDAAALDLTAAPPTLLTVRTKDQPLRSSRLVAVRLAAGPGKRVLRECAGEPHGLFDFGTSESAERINADILDFLAAVEPGPA